MKREIEDYIKQKTEQDRQRFAIAKFMIIFSILLIIICLVIAIVALLYI